MSYLSGSQCTISQQLVESDECRAVGDVCDIHPLLFCHAAVAPGIASNSLPPISPHRGLRSALLPLSSSVRTSRLGSSAQLSSQSG